MLRPDLHVTVVKEDKVTGADIGRAQRDAHRVFMVDAVEIDQTLQCGLQRCGVIEADLARIAKAGSEGTRVEKFVLPLQNGHGSGIGAERFVDGVFDAFLKRGKAKPQHVDGFSSKACRHRWGSAHGFPEIPKSFHPLFRGVTGDDGRVNGTNRDAGDPGRVNACFGHAFVDARLIGTKGAAALENEDNLLVGRELDLVHVGGSSAGRLCCLSWSDELCNVSCVTVIVF